jgi:hypothetical protein
MEWNVKCNTYLLWIAELECNKKKDQLQACLHIYTPIPNAPLDFLASKYRHLNNCPSNATKINLPSPYLSLGSGTVMLLLLLGGGGGGGC